ncbi:DUF4198 domain-containing protein [Alteromonas halophila]|uniref:DUF4198 domain-containing protein n=1 Tax=Alteromonas halophila TaxID=516698 RepID=A0A918MXZ5_9ALTE|nr:DUF4198 domain-containing protein [Alteromonas halophila]GGW83187.1 hypothetical protein GCM10007391_15680 [Alteromonas halophila]
MTNRVKLKFIGLCCLLTAFTPHLHAHDFWLEPGQFYYESATSVPIQFKVGHNKDADNWNLTWDKVVALRSYSSTGVTDMAASIIPRSGFMPGVAKLQKRKPGSYVIGFESYHSVSTLDAEKFNGYLEEEGLKQIQTHRRENDLSNTPGTEIYSRKAKSIVQIGNTLSDTVTRPIGHTLEIIPLQHPASLKEDGALPVQVLFRGEPLHNAMIDAMPLGEASHQIQTLTTDKNGNATFHFTESGPVKLNVVWGVPVENNDRADYETYFSSLTFTVSRTSS